MAAHLLLWSIPADSRPARGTGAKAKMAAHEPRDQARFKKAGCVWALFLALWALAAWALSAAEFGADQAARQKAR